MILSLILVDHVKLSGASFELEAALNCSFTLLREALKRWKGSFLPLNSLNLKALYQIRFVSSTLPYSKVKMSEPSRDLT